MHQKINQNLGPITNILKQEGAIFAYLFGSQASGKTGTLSDFDMAVYLKGDNRHHLKKQLRLAHAIEKQIGLKTDVVIFNDASPVLSQQIISSGKLIFDSDKSARLDFEARTLQSYEDTAYFRAVFYQAMEERINNQRIGEFTHG